MQGKGELMDEYLRLLALGHSGTFAHERVFAKKLANFERRWRRAAQSGRYGP